MAINTLSDLLSPLRLVLLKLNNRELWDALGALMDHNTDRSDSVRGVFSSFFGVFRAFYDLRSFEKLD